MFLQKTFHEDNQRRFLINVINKYINDEIVGNYKNIRITFFLI